MITIYNMFKKCNSCSDQSTDLAWAIHKMRLLFRSEYRVGLGHPQSAAVVFMPYYGLFWTRSPYLDLRWRSCSTGTIPELLITSIVQHKKKNRWVGDPLWRSCSLFCVVIFHSSFELVKYPNTKQFTWSPQGIPPSPVLVIRSEYRVGLGHPQSVRLFSSEYRPSLHVLVSWEFCSYCLLDVGCIAYWSTSIQTKGVSVCLMWY